MGDGNDGAATQAQVADEPQAQGDQAAQQQAAQMTAAPQDGGDVVAQAHKDYEAALAERDARIAELESETAGARNVKAARALLADHDNNIEKLKAAEPWLFSAPAAPAPTGATGLPSAGAAGADESTQMSRWRKIAGLPESEERAAAGGSGRARRADGARGGVKRPL